MRTKQKECNQMGQGNFYASEKGTKINRREFVGKVLAGAVVISAKAAMAGGLMALETHSFTAVTDADQSNDVIGTTPIPFYTGNLSVGAFMRYFGTSRGGSMTDLVTEVTEQHLALLKRIGVFADCEYQSWPVAEQKKGTWDFSLYQESAKRLHEAGLKYVVFSW